MARLIRYIIPELPHHAIQRGNNRQSIFFEQSDRVYFLNRLKKIAKEEKVEIGSYCLMTNHIHLLLYPKEEKGLIKVMKDTAQYYTQYINRKYKRTGKLWENRYKLQIIDPEKEWIIARYIENNPVRAGVVKLAENYKYSSAKANLTGTQDALITKDIVKEGRQDYRDFFYDVEANDASHIKQIGIAAEQQKVFGSMKFVNWIEGKFGACLKVRKRGRPPKANSNSDK